MTLSFRYQFVLAPFVIVVLLAVLVVYTLFELSNINHENEVTRQWEILTDRIQTAIAGATRLNKTILNLPSVQDIQQEDDFFSYLEQTRILADSLKDPYLLDELPLELRQQIQSSVQLLREPEKIKPTTINHSLVTLLPSLEYQYKIIAAQRRSAFIDNHLKLIAVSSRMTTILLVGLIVCILLAAGLALWGLNVVRRRLKLLTQRAHVMCAGDNLAFAEPATTHDELDELQICLANMTARLVNTLSIENVLRGAEDERRRIAMEMHDGVLADLTAVNRRLDGLILNGSSHEQTTRDKIVALRTEVDDVIRNLRRTIDDLHPQVLETLGLESALQSYLQRHGADGGFPRYHFEFEPALENKLPVEHKLNLFRIVTEGVNNIIKHAHCDRFEVSLRVVGQQLVVSIEDNGTGMTEKMDATANTGAHGCANMAERARLMGAAVQWRASRFASGTCFELNMPLQQIQ